MLRSEEWEVMGNCFEYVADGRLSGCSIAATKITYENPNRISHHANCVFY